MSKTNKQSICDQVCKAIEAGEVAMKPRWHFIIKTLLFVFGVVFLFLALVHIFSLTLFVLGQNGLWAAPSFGWQGLGIFIISLPWVLIFVSVIFIYLLEILVKRYAFAYRKPLLYSVLGIILFTFTSGAVVARTKLHERLELRAHNSRLPIAGGMYKKMEHAPPQQVHAGFLLEFNKGGFVMTTRFGDTIIVATSSETVLPSTIELMPDDTVVVMGKKRKDQVKARGITQSKKRLHCINCYRGKNKNVK